MYILGLIIAPQHDIRAKTKCKSEVLCRDLPNSTCGEGGKCRTVYAFLVDHRKISVSRHKSGLEDRKRACAAAQALSHTLCLRLTRTHVQSKGEVELKTKPHHWFRRAYKASPDHRRSDVACASRKKRSRLQRVREYIHWTMLIWPGYCVFVTDPPDGSSNKQTSPPPRPDSAYAAPRLQSSLADGQDDFRSVSSSVSNTLGTLPQRCVAPAPACQQQDDRKERLTYSLLL